MSLADLLSISPIPSSIYEHVGVLSPGQKPKAPAFCPCGHRPIGAGPALAVAVDSCDSTWRADQPPPWCVSPSPPLLQLAQHLPIPLGLVFLAGLSLLGLLCGFRWQLFLIGCFRYWALLRRCSQIAGGSQSFSSDRWERSAKASPGPRGRPPSHLLPPP